jgi:hypothetical protein
LHNTVNEAVDGENPLGSLRAANKANFEEDVASAVAEWIVLLDLDEQSKGSQV